MASPYTVPSKVMARESNIAVYRAFTGHDSIPAGREYWTLCNVQDDNPDCEIEQMARLGFIKKSQYVGVDRNASNIETCRVFHPGARWICDEWDDAISTESFSPGVLFIDSTSLAGRITQNMTAMTMNRVDAAGVKGVVLLVNVMQTNPYGGRVPVETQEFLSGIGRRVFRFAEWCRGIKMFEYVAHKTLMRTYGFYRGVA